MTVLHLAQEEWAGGKEEHTSCRSDCTGIVQNTTRCSYKMNTLGSSIAMSCQREELWPERDDMALALLVVAEDLGATSCTAPEQSKLQYQQMTC